jgi:hypothetical protein
VPNDINNSCDPGNTPEIFCQEFNTQSVSYDIEGGSIAPSTSGGTVISVYSRGLYFTTSSFTFMVLDQLRLPVNFTLTMFIRQNLPKNNETNAIFATQTVTEPAHLTWRIRVRALETEIFRDNASDGLVSQADGISHDQWYHVALCIEEDLSTRRSTLKQFIDGAAAGTG